MLDLDVLSRFASDMAAAYGRLATGLSAPSSKPLQYVKGPDLVDILPGYRQRAVAKFMSGVGADGASTREVNDGIGYDFSNTYTTMHRLKDLGIVELVAGVQPQRWRLAARYRK
jgi:hypothetical protein